MGQDHETVVDQLVADLGVRSYFERGDLLGLASMVTSHFSTIFDAAAAQLELARSTQDELYRVSMETPSHTKWLLAGGFGFDLSVWCHQFKEVSTASASYATSLHDHRYDFVSLLLCGGYRSTVFPHVAGGSGLDMTAPRSFFTGAGQSNLMQVNDAHRLTEIDPLTVSLVFQGPSIRSESSTYDESGATARTFNNLEFRMAVLRDTLSLARAGRGPITGALP